LGKKEAFCLRAKALGKVRLMAQSLFAVAKP